MASDNPFAGKGLPPQATRGPSAPASTTSGPSSIGKASRGQSSSRRLSLVPTLVALALVVVGVVLAIQVLRGLNSDGTLPWAILGYVLTPFLVASCLVWARALDLRGQGDPGYLKADGQRRLKVLGFIVLLSFVPALAFIWYIASYIGSVIA